jgi:long-chain fatty acid transport protein
LKRTRIVVIGLALAALLVPQLAAATNGYFSHGIGIKSKGMGGAGLAYPQDALVGGTNPAGFAFIDDRFDIGVDYFRPDRGSEITGSMAPVNMTYDGNGEEAFFMPDAGVRMGLSDRVAVGLTVFGNGGMNTSYDTPIGLFGSTDAGVNLMQLFIVPSVAVKVNENHAFGLGVNVAWQSFEATGLQNFDNEMMTTEPGSVTDNDASTSTGFGARVGYLGHFGCAVRLAAAYQTRTYMGEFDEYAGLFAESGGFDIPSSFSGGIAITPNDRLVAALDFSYIMYSEINSIANPLLPNLGEAPLGDENGAGFGWEDVTVVKVGLAYDVSETLTLRGGFNYGGQPIPASETLFNMIAPGVVETHVTFGGTWMLNEQMELSFAYMHAFENTIEGEDSIPMDFGGGEADLTMSQDSFGLGFGMLF